MNDLMGINPSKGNQGTGQKVQEGGAFRNVVVRKHMTHPPPLPTGAKRSDPPLNEG